MDTFKQLGLFTLESKPPTTAIKTEWGTFKDSLRAPIHRWFTYPAGFSYKAVEHSIKRFGVKIGQTIYDPFMGSGTTNLVAKTLGIHSIGVEAHPFVFKIARAKLCWEINEAHVHNFIQYAQKHLLAESNRLRTQELTDEFPELILKCYEPKTIYDLWALREIIQGYCMGDDLHQFFFVVVTALLREVSTAATGWPYIAPKKKKVTSFDKDVLTEFSKLAWRMAQDIEKIKRLSGGNYLHSEHQLVNCDSKYTQSLIADSSIDHVFTSPPYLNNFDYADRTRLELYFWGEAATWGEISTNVRTKLMTSATTQIERSDPKYHISNALQQECPGVAEFVQNAADELAVRRKMKGGKKSYDLMVIGYFNDIHLIIKEVYRVLRPNSYALFVLGDSAPYGVHVPTDNLIGDIGLAVGFCNYKTEVLRTRGGKWSKNPQRHSVQLRESIIILEKG